MFKKMIMPIHLLVFIFLISANAQDDKSSTELPKFGWENKFIGSLNLTQTQLDNWSQGGENAWTWQANLNASFVNNQEKFTWSNTGKVIFGQARIGGDKVKKTDDEIYLETVYRRNLMPELNPYISATALTQFTAGYDYSQEPRLKISNFLDPGYFTESIGLIYKPDEKFQTRFGFALKQTVADVFAPKYSDDPETGDTVEKFRNQYGAESMTDYKTNLNEIIVYVTKLQLFSSFESFNTVDVRWDNLVSAKVSEYIAVSFNFLLYYDRDISLKRQIKQTLAVGLTYSFI